MSLFGKKGRGIIVDNNIVRNNRNLSDDDIERMQQKTNMLINASKIVTIAVMAAIALYIILWDNNIFTTGNFIEQLILAIVSIVLCGIGANGLMYHLIAKRAEGTFWTAYRQLYLVNMASATPGIDYITYKEEPGLSYEEIRASVLVLCKYYKLCRTQDSLYGEINGDSFRLTNLKAGVPKRQENGRTKELTVFSGIMGMFWGDQREALVKLGFVQFFSKDYDPSVAGYVADHEFEPDDDDLKEKFTIYAQKPKVIGSLLNDEFKEALEALADSIEAPVALSFNGGNMFIAINDYPDIFEAKLNESVIKQKEEVRKIMDCVICAKEVYDVAAKLCS